MGKKAKKIPVPVTDYLLAKRVWEIVRDADLNVLTYRDVRKALESWFGRSLREERSRIEKCIQRSCTRKRTLEKDARDAASHGNDNAAAFEESRSQEDAAAQETEPVKITRKSRKREKAQEEAESAPTPKKKKYCIRSSTMCRASPELQAITGDRRLRRSEAVRGLFKYIRENKLQDPDNRPMVRCADNKLYDLFKVDHINFFHINKELQRHLLPCEDGYDSIDGRAASPSRTRASSFLTPCPISEALQSFFSTDRKSMSRAEVIESIWDYILDNRLQDLQDSKFRIRCDAKLQALIGVGACSIRKLPRYLEQHFRSVEQSNLSSPKHVQQGKQL